ncbi:MAG: heavy-metal-associated domain-containing protein [Deltaproteobacteria bacterium]
MDILEFNIPGMTCETCAGRIKSALANTGVTDISFDFKTRNASLTYDNQKTNPQEIKRLIRKAGYEVN